MNIFFINAILFLLQKYEKINKIRKNEQMYYLKSE